MSNSKVRPKDQRASGVRVETCRELRMAALQAQTRRHFLRTLGGGLGTIFAGTSLAQYAMPGKESARSESSALDFTRDPSSPLSELPPQFAAKVRRVIYLHMAGAPSQLELFEHKPDLKGLDGQDCPASFLAGKRFAFISGVPKLLGSQYPFHQVGQSGHWISDRLPHLEQHLDDICFIKSMRTDQFNHAPAQLLVHTGNARLGYASFGSWVLYGLGTENQNLPGFIVLLSGGKSPDGGKQLWSSGFLPSVYQGVQCRSHGEPVLYLDNPPETSRSLRRDMLDAIDQINQQTYAAFGNPETITRIAQYEMAFRMQMDATDAMDIHKEPDSVRAMYGSKPGESSFANNCLVARRLAERGVRFIQLYHWGWDSHGADAKEALNLGFADRCREVDQP
ncbi:MAG: sulfatase, partial [Acidobacteria bacterium]